MNLALVAIIAPCVFGFYITSLVFPADTSIICDYLVNCIRVFSDISHGCRNIIVINQAFSGITYRNGLYMLSVVITVIRFRTIRSHSVSCCRSVIGFSRRALALLIYYEIVCDISLWVKHFS